MEKKLWIHFDYFEPGTGWDGAVGCGCGGIEWMDPWGLLDRCIFYLEVGSNPISIIPHNIIHSHAHDHDRGEPQESKLYPQLEACLLILVIHVATIRLFSTHRCVMHRYTLYLLCTNHHCVFWSPRAILFTPTRFYAQIAISCHGRPYAHSHPHIYKYPC